MTRPTAGRPGRWPQRQAIRLRSHPAIAAGQCVVRFRVADGKVIGGPRLTLTAGTVGTWEFDIRGIEPVPTGGGFLIERFSFLLGHAPQADNPQGRDYVTLEPHTSADLRLTVDSLNHSNWPSVAHVEVAAGHLAGDDGFTLRIGDRRAGGAGSEVYDVTTTGRLVVSVDRTGHRPYRQVEAGETRVHIVAEAQPALLSVLGPSIVAPHEPFALHLVMYDRHHNVCAQYRGRIRLRAPDGAVTGLPEYHELGAAEAGIGIIPGVRIATPGLIRIEAQDPDAGLRARGNPIRCEAEPPTRLLWGDLHSHSWGDVSMSLMDDPNSKLHPSARHDQARRMARLDFAAPGPMAPPEHDHRPGVWAAHRRAVAANDQPGHYVPFLASEAHPRIGGDRNVVFRDDEPEHLPAFVSMDDVLAAYGDRDDVLIEAHVGGGPADWDAYPTEREPLIEIASGHGSFEWLLQRALRHGHRPAVIGSGDTHLPALAAPMAAHLFRGRFQRVLNVRDCAYGSGPVAAIWADACERQAIWRAIGQRRTFATTGARIILELTVNGNPAGSEAEITSPVEVAIRAHACAPIERLDLIRGDRSLRSWRPDELDVELAFSDERPLRETTYYLRLRQTDGEHAWSTPVWTSCAQGSEQPADDLPAWNAHEPVDLAGVRPNEAEAYEPGLRRYLETEEDPDLFHDLTPVRMVDEVPGRAVLFYGYLGAAREPISLRWYVGFELPRLHLDWGWRDFGMRDGG